MYKTCAALIAVRRGGTEIDVCRRSASGVWTGKPGQRGPRRGIALLAVFAVFLQAMLFAWHSHPLAVASRGISGVPTATAAAEHQAPGTADDDECQICFALGHHSAAPVDWVAAATPTHVSASPSATEATDVPLPPYLLFRSRAPPRA